MSDDEAPTGPVTPPETELESTVLGGGPTGRDAGVEERIGPYRLVRRIGEGGMGSVYEAIQEHPIRRRVALKLIRVGMDTKRVIARFELERQTLALLNHPCIAKVLDAGATEMGRPYFVMEYVEGEALNRYCDRTRMGVGERLKLFIRVCEGVQHAHQKGIIHRDLKPSNVLVEDVDGRPTPKVIDFGIARVTEGGGGESGLTQFGEFVGTPAYMSPEQATAHADLDIRTDVYSLGVMLYEIIVGSLPLDPVSVREKGLEEMLRALREDSPERPSQRFTTVSARQAALAELRRTDPVHLRRQLRGDVDWIVMRAIEKERERRYSSVSELGGDIGRHLRHEPVLAGPPSASYRAKKFVRRHRVGVAAASLVVLSLVVGVIATTTAMMRAMRAEREARIEAQTATRISDYLVGIFDRVDPGTTRGDTITAREILDQGVERIRSDLQDEPDVRARLLETMGRVYRSLSLYDEARPLLEEALEVRENLPEEDVLETAKVLMVLSGLFQKTGNIEDALLAAGRARELCEQSRTDCPVPFSVQVGTNIGAILLSAKRYEEARPELLRALRLAESELGSDHEEVGKILVNLGVLENREKRYEDAVGYYERALPIARKANGEVHPLTAAILNNLGNARKRTGDLAGARAHLEAALSIQRRLYDGDHDNTATSLNALSEVCLLAQDVGCAVSTAEEALAMRERVLGAGHAHTLRSARTLYDAYAAAGQTRKRTALVSRYAVEE